MKNQKGITLIALAITIVVVIILSSIIINIGRNSIKKSQLESLKTNMLLIKAKAKEYVEQANFKSGPQNSYKDDGGNLKAEVSAELKGTSADANNYSYITLEEGQYLYDVNSELENMGLKNISIDTTKSEKFLVRYDIPNAKVEVYNTVGYDDNGNKKYSLTDIEKIEY